MQRAKKNEQPEHMKRGYSAVLEQVRQKFVRYAADLKALPDIQMPPELINRVGDNWEPMLQLAHLAGPRWWHLILEAALADAASGLPTEGTVIPLLHDIRVVFGTKVRLRTEDLCRGLLELPDPSGEWGRCNRGGDVSAYYLRTKLRNLLDPPNAQKWKEGGRDIRGYLIGQFKDSFERYLDPEEPAPDQPQPAGLPKSASRKHKTKTQRKRKHSNSAEADAKTTNRGDGTTSCDDEKNASFPQAASAPSAPSATAADILNDINGVFHADTVADGKISSAPGQHQSATAPSGPRPVADELGLVADEVSPSAPEKTKFQQRLTVPVADGADGADEISGKYEEKMQRLGDGPNQSLTHSEQLQPHDKMQGPTEELL